MLRVTMRTSTDGTTLILEGRVKGPWVSELEKAWHQALNAHDDRPVVVDLSGVNFADGRGRKLLLEMRSQGATLVGSSSFLRTMLESGLNHEPNHEEAREA